MTLAFHDVPVTAAPPLSGVPGPVRARPARPLLLVGAGAWAAVAAALVLADGADWGRHVGDLSSVLFPALAAAACRSAARSCSGAQRRCWGLFAAASGLWAAAAVLRTAYGLVGDGTHPVPAAYDLAVLGWVPLTVAGLLGLLLRRSRLGVAVIVLDGAVMALSLSFIVVATALAGRTAQTDGLERVVRLAHPVGDLVVLALLLALGLRVAAGRRRTWWLLGAGVSCLSVTDVLAARLQSGGDGRPGALALGWAAGFLLVVAAARSGGLEVGDARRSGTGRALLPYAVKVLACVVAAANAAAVAGSPLLLGLGGAVLLVGVARQVLVVVSKTALADSLGTRLADTTTELLAEQGFLRAVMDNLHAGVAACDATGRLTFGNRALAGFGGDGGQDGEQGPQRRWTELYDRDGVTPLPWDRTPLMRALAGEHVVDVEVVMVATSGRVTTLSANGSPLRDASGACAGAVVTLHDVSATIQHVQELRLQARRDHLTGLGNRSAYQEDLAGLARTGRPLAVLLLDLDDFKVVNDSLGHEVGDACLTVAAGRLAAALPEGGTAYRLGGDEFVALLAGADAPASVAVAERLVARIAAPADVAGAELETTVSIGIALSGRDRGTPGELLRAADLAMYQAKAAGKGSYAMFEERLQQAAVERLALENDLRKAVRANELSVVYQPIVDLATGRMTTVEALVRWQHVVRGAVSPVDFIPVAEETGLILPLGEQVLKQACRQLLAWDADGGDPTFQVAVNVSTRQLERPGLLAALDECLASGVRPSRLILEVTETALTLDSALADLTLEAVRDRGVHVAVDDFGTGYSSLARLRSAPVNRLKIDRAFIDEIAGPDSDVPIVEATMAMARGLGLGVVAEGVETAEQLDFLRGAGCPQAQGFLLSRPVPAQEIRSLMAGPRPWDDAFATTLPVATSRDRFTELVELAVSPEVGLEQLVRPLLQELRSRTGLGISYLSRMHHASDELEVLLLDAAAPGALVEGVVVPWTDSPCRYALEHGPQRTRDAAEAYPGSGVARDLGLGSFLTEPVLRPDGQLYGTLCAADDASVPVTARHSATLQMFARLISGKLALLDGHDQPGRAAGSVLGSETRRA